MDFDNAVTINRPTAEVFTFLSDFENVPLWNYAISETRRTDTGPLGVGARYSQVRTIPTPSSEAFEVTAFRPDRLIAIRGTLGPFRAESSYRLEDIDGRTLLTNSIRLEATGVRRLAAALAGSQVRSAVAANLGVLKQLLEGRPSILVSRRPTAASGVSSGDEPARRDRGDGSRRPGWRRTPRS